VKDDDPFEAGRRHLGRALTGFLGGLPSPYIHGPRFSWASNLRNRSLSRKPGGDYQLKILCKTHMMLCILHKRRLLTCRMVRR